MDSAARIHLARSLSQVENRQGNWRGVLTKSYAESGDVFIIGITGPPGCGKSTLIDALASRWAQLGMTIGILAIDPSSPFSGGAILGDRLRMRHLEDHDNVFIRSMSARGHAGGLNAAAIDLCMVMAAHGCTYVVLEAVGSGQSEIEIGFVADCTIVVAVPGFGDSVQAAKAGLMEIGDLYVVNKSDLPQAKSVQQDLSAMLSVSFSGRPGLNEMSREPVRLRPAGAMPPILCERYGDPLNDSPYWHPPVRAAAINHPELIAEISDSIEAFRRWLTGSGHLRKRRVRCFANHALDIARHRVFESLLGELSQRAGQPYQEWADKQFAQGLTDPHRLADMMSEVIGSDRPMRH